MNTRIALMLAIVLGVVAALAARVWVQNERTALEREKRTMPVVAARARIPAGGRLDAQRNLTAKEFPRGEVAPGMLAYSDTEVNRLHGQIASREILPGEIVFSQFIESDSLRRETRNTLVTPGKVGVTLRVDALSSHNFMMRPGDYVDIVGLFPVPTGTFPELSGGEGAPARPAAPAPGTELAARLPTHTSTLLFAEAVRILAVDNRTIDRMVGAVRDLRYTTITIELDPDNAYRLQDAVFKGAQLTYLLRAPGSTVVRYPGVHEVKYEDFKLIGKQAAPRTEPGGEFNWHED